MFSKGVRFRPSLFLLDLRIQFLLGRVKLSLSGSGLLALLGKGPCQGLALLTTLKTSRKDVLYYYYYVIVYAKTMTYDKYRKCS